MDDIGSLDDLETIEVILEAKRIPLGSTVRKITGTKTFVLGDTLVLYTENGVKKEIKVDSSARILLSSGSFIHNTIGEDKKLVWVASVNDIILCFEETPQ